MKMFKDFLKEEDGLGTVEIVLLIAVLVGLALLFKKHIVKFVADILGNIKGNEIDPDTIKETSVE
ncbi:Flp1 family type IVb pilin [Paramaledivibacter caminithermalis]|jgi:Flp pilus assembly pilin Flp|uniref:Putative Flagellin, Flp1-like, domain n=1 Tax=Paramaledivibacter caminithermalis (strain DSM 15212 / CIP 107654 / DViRD3) TaxID=1121301 RepID=A0A1M6PHT3_PARC5|nr:Flp1 family type IVb pilin [Paramaledivibacter caminithermalis]SHK07499.1 Putative Flagellin, Flp1-like, domain [Paramaledivibacter caminithermalis DSM 15212]